MQKIPTMLVTGFLGAGKSTFINKIIAAKKECRFGLLVNEYGDVKLESQIIEAGSNEIVELSNGCLCCVVRQDLISALDKLIDAPVRPDYIIIEASGVSDPLPVIGTIIHSSLFDKIALNAVVTIADLLNCEEYLAQYATARNQFKNSDFILLSKTDLASRAVKEETVRQISKIAPESSIMTIDDSLDLDLLLGTALHTADNLVFSTPVHDELTAVFYKSATPLCFDKMVAFFDRHREIYRAKGEIYFHDRDLRGKKYLLQLSGARKELISTPQEEIRESSLLMIGPAIDETLIKMELEKCRS